MERFIPTLKRILRKDFIKNYLFPGSTNESRAQKVKISKPTKNKIGIPDILEDDSIWKALKRPQVERSNLELSCELERLSSQLENIAGTTQDIMKAICKSDSGKRISS